MNNVSSFGPVVTAFMLVVLFPSVTQVVRTLAEPSSHFK